MPSLQVPGTNRVEPFDSANSYLIHKLEGTGMLPRMPLGGPFLDPATVDMIKAWIDGGALNN